MFGYVKSYDFLNFFMKYFSFALEKRGHYLIYLSFWQGKHDFATVGSLATALIFG